jgi:hypothetical protein
MIGKMVDWHINKEFFWNSRFGILQMSCYKVSLNLLFPLEQLVLRFAETERTSGKHG